MKAAKGESGKYKRDINGDGSKKEYSGTNDKIYYTFIVLSIILLVLGALYFAWCFYQKRK